MTSREPISGITRTSSYRSPTKKGHFVGKHAICLHMDDDADVFGPLLGLEEAFTSKGRKVGYEDGRVSGSQDARAFGVGKGYDVGEEIGFYLGVALMCRRLGLSAQKPKAAAAANAVLAIAEALPVRAPPSRQCDVVGQLESLRAKFKLLRSLLATHSIPEFDARRKFAAKHLTF